MPTFTIVPTSCSQTGAWTNSDSTSANLHTYIDELIAAPHDINYVRGAAGSDEVEAGFMRFGWTLPVDFGVMTSETKTLTLRSAVQNRTDDSLGWEGPITFYAADGTTALLTATTGVTTFTTTTYSNFTRTMTVSATGLTATKTDWEAGFLSLGQHYSQVMSDDGAFVKLSALQLTGTYEYPDSPTRAFSEAKFAAGTHRGGPFKAA